jgi:hypothetical protein
MRSRTLLIALGVVVLTGAALGAGVALGSGSTHGDALPPKAAPGEAVTVRSSAKPTLPRVQAYAYFYGDGSISPPSKKVVAVHRIAAGDYCVELATSIRVSATTFANVFVDYFNTTSLLTVAEQYSLGNWCSSHGFSNSVPILVFSNDTGTAVPQDAAVFFSIP